MANSPVLMIKQETRWGSIPPQPQFQQQPVYQQYGGQASIFNNYSAPVAMNQPVQQYPVMQQPMQQQPIISQQYGNGNTTNIFNNYSAPVAMNQPVQQYPAMQQPMQQQPMISQQYGNGNTTNIFNNYIEQQPMIQQPNLMTPQVPAQQPTQIVFVPANLGTTQPASTAPATSSNDSAMKFMLMMMTMLLGSLNKKEAADKDDIEEENIETTDPKKTDSQSKTDNLDGKEVDGTIYYTASNLNKTVSDKAGKTKTQIGGSNNKINFKGDDGENTFIVGGKNNNTTIEDIGGDDKIVLEGNKYDWKVVSTEDVDKSGKNVEIFWVKHSVQGKVKVVLKNEKTGSTVTLITKKGDLNEMRTRIATCTNLTER